MKFENFSTAEHVHFNRRLPKVADLFSDADSWQGEPLDCLLEVERSSSEEIVLSCTESCGAHTKLEFNREEYDEYSSVLGEALLLRSSIGVYLAEKESREEDNYCLSEESLNIAQLISMQVRKQAV